MMEFFAVYMEEKNKKPFLHEERHIQCVITYFYAPWDLNPCLSDAWHTSLTSQHKL